MYNPGQKPCTLANTIIFLFTSLSLACKQAPGEDGKKFSASAKQKNSESEAIGVGLVQAQQEPVRRLPSLNCFGLEGD